MADYEKYKRAKEQSIQSWRCTLYEKAGAKSDVEFLSCGFCAEYTRGVHRDKSCPICPVYKANGNKDCIENIGLCVAMEDKTPAGPMAILLWLLSDDLKQFA